MSLSPLLHRPPSTESTTAEDAGEAGGRRRARPVVGWVLTVLAGLFVLLALNLPHELGQLAPKTFVRIPVEALLGVAVLLALPARARRIVAPLLGVALVLLTVLKILDMGFIAVFVRPFDPVYDWSLVGDGVTFLSGSIGRAGSIGVVVGTVAVLLAVLVLMVLAVRRLTRVAVGHQTVVTRAVATLTVVWVVCAAFGGSVPGLPVAGHDTASLAYRTARAVPASVRAQREFEATAKIDAFRNTPADQLLTGLRGKDVVFTFVESYGRSAVEDPAFAPQVDALLNAGTRKLKAAGLASRSAFLTSSTVGGGSWLAHGSLYSGLWINSPQRYHQLVRSDRLTLTRAFRDADWRTVGVMPGLTGAWPEGKFFGYDKVYDARNLGFRGERYGLWSATPDQYTLSALQQFERSKPGHAPIMAELELTTSHAPWVYLPKPVDWDAVGDGTATAGHSPRAVSHDAAVVRPQYLRTIDYSLNTVISYLQKYGDDNLVFVFLGDHQPVPLVTGTGASRDVPITIVARDQAVLDRVSGWGWTDGLNPAPTAPVWRMDSFRDRFLTAFGSQPR